MKSWSPTFATQLLFRRSGSQLFDTSKNNILLRIFPLQNIYSWKMLRKQKWQIPGEPLTAWYNWCQGPVPGHSSAFEKHYSRVRDYLLTPWSRVLLEKLTGFELVKKFPPFHGTRRFITTVASARHLSQSISPGPRITLWLFRNTIHFYGEELLAPCPTPKLEDHTLSAVCDCLFNTLAATLHIGRRSSIRNLGGWETLF